MESRLIYPNRPPAEPPMPEKPEPGKTGLWGAHDPAVFRDPEGGKYFMYCTGGNIFRSDDMVSWEYIGKIIEKVPEEVFRWTGSDGLWAPDIIKVGDEYRMYCSNSTFGSQRSAIYLAVSDRPEGPFEYRGMVVRTNGNSPVNAIDANPIKDAHSDDVYMAFGSFWGGIRLMKLDCEGLADDRSLCKDGRTPLSAMGPLIACRPDWTTTGIEGSYIKYNPKNEYYYLFASYGSLASDYNIRVGRSRYITGPYVDMNGRPMTDEIDNDLRTGYMIACGYRFENSQGWMGPGHNSVLNDDGEWYLMSHIRPYAVNGPVLSTMHLRRMVWSPDGWPMASPEPYAGEPIQPVPASEMTGLYEWITLMPMLPQSVIGSAPFALMDGGKMRLSGYVKGYWTTYGENGLIVEIGGGHTVTGAALTAWDHENDRPTLVFTGITNEGVAVWAKKVK
ncbi:MAG: arabinan endo-1,5-alpha-L-arabinosidase [Christensenellaceae bacterium]|nr:arabinan endo-1,5-alpha-L-arabinosidase [Christensenellaceae bacterium]